MNYVLPIACEWERIASGDEIKESPKHRVFVVLTPVTRITDPCMTVGFVDLSEDYPRNLDTASILGNDGDTSAECNAAECCVAPDIFHIDLGREARHTQLAQDQAARFRARILLGKQEPLRS